MGKAQAAVSADFTGVDTAKFDAHAIAEALEHFGIRPSDKASLEARAGMLKNHFDELEAERKPGVKFVDCTECGASSTSDLDKCPFCGIGEEDSTPAIPDPEETGDEGDGDIPEPDDVSGEDVPEPAVAAVEPPPSPVADQKLTPLKKPRKSKETALATVEPKQVALEGVIDEKASEVDKFVARIKYLRRATEVGGYMLAKELATGEISGVWKTRLDAKQKSVFKNFDAFAQVELGMSSHYVRDMLKMYNQFTEEQFKQIGPSKLRLVIQVSPDARPNLLEKIKGGASKRQIEREIGHKGRDAQGAKGAKLELAKSGKITLAMVEGKSKFPFFIKPEKKGDEPKPAKRIGQTPWARLPISINDVEVLVTVMLNKRGEFEGVCEVRRVDPVK